MVSDKFSFSSLAHLDLDVSKNSFENLIDEVMGFRRDRSEAIQRRKRILFVICIALMPILPMVLSSSAAAYGEQLAWYWALAAFCLPAITLVLLRFSDAESVVAICYSLAVIAIIAHGPIISGDFDNTLLVLLVLAPIIMGFTAGATASAIGTLSVLGINLVVLIRGVAMNEQVLANSFNMLACSSIVTFLCGMLVFYFARQTEKESDILHEDNARIRNMALTDPLTKLSNRRAFQDDMLRHSLPNGSTAKPALFILDLDGFKQINDTHGHDVGDTVLRVFSRRLQSIINDGLEVYRLGGDEFAIVCADRPSLSENEALGRMIITLTEQPINTRGTIVEFDVSVGIALSDGSTKSIQSLYQQADMAAFVAKEKPGSNFIVFDKMLDSKTNRKLEVERALKTAIEYKTINVAFQPQVDFRTGTITGFEALARWRDPALGAVPPDEFIQIAEESSLVKVLDRLIIAKALESAGKWLGKSQRVSVNASARSLGAKEFAAFVIKQAQLNGLEPRQVEVEITETSLVQNLEKAQRTMEALTSAGIRIALDDFGVGYSSLSYLVDFPVQKIKFDRSFLLKASDSSTVLVMESIAQLANKMEVDLVAEGVETTDQLKLLKGINCFIGQGYLFSRPILSEKMIEATQSLKKAA